MILAGLLPGLFHDDFLAIARPAADKFTDFDSLRFSII